MLSLCREWDIYTSMNFGTSIVTTYKEEQQLFFKAKTNIFSDNFLQQHVLTKTTHQRTPN